MGENSNSNCNSTPHHLFLSKQMLHPYKDELNFFAGLKSGYLSHHQIEQLLFNHCI
jgi:hypothetical protein